MQSPTMGRSTITANGDQKGSENAARGADYTKDDLPTMARCKPINPGSAASGDWGKVRTGVDVNAGAIRPGYK